MEPIAQWLEKQLPVEIIALDTGLEKRKHITICN
jgi:hypothetical protein